MLEHGIGEFCLLYGRFEERYQVSSVKTREKMFEILGDNKVDLKVYQERGKKKNIHCHMPLEIFCFIRVQIPIRLI